MSHNNPVESLGSSRTILIVNASQTAQQKISACLIAAGYPRFLIAHSATQALRILRTENVDLLIADVNTSDLDGWRLSRLVRSGMLKCSADLPIIIASATWCERIAEITARDYGIHFVLPLDHIERLPYMVNNLLGDQSNVISKPRLLVIEDQEEVYEPIERILASQFEIEIQTDGLNGLAAWRDGRHDLVLLDIMLPRLSGRDILIEIMQINSEQPVVVMTAHSSIDQAEELMLLGAVDFLSKPFRADQLRQVTNIAVHREDYLVSNEQFAARVQLLEERTQAYQHLYETHQQLLDDLQSIVMEIDDQFNICFINRAWEDTMGFSSQETIGRSIQDFVARDESSHFYSLRKKLNAVLLQEKQVSSIELCFLNKKHQKLWLLLKISKSTNTGQSTRLTLCLDNVTKQREAQSRLKHLAMHDSLTGLYNRHYFESALSQFAADATRNNRQHGLIYIDLDHFKVINDSFGHQRGDEVLRDMSSLLNKRVRKPDILCRLGGDEFAVLLHDVTVADAQKFAEDVQRIISEFSFQSHEQRINLGCSIGFTIIDSSIAQGEEHLMRADMALYVAKGRGRNFIRQFDPRDSESDELRNRLKVSQKIRKAIAEDRMVLYFQPIYSLAEKQVSYYEALIRLREPNGDIVGPAHFIPALEASGEMYLLDRWIIKLATRTLNANPQLSHVAINLSAQAFKDESLVPTILDSLKETDVNPDRITFELTESASLFNLQMTQSVIDELHKLGCSFSVDDFGSGFSSFAYLKDLPADYIKLDGSFIKNLHRDPIDQTLVKSIIQVIQALGKKAVAEYVENAEILTILESMGIDYVQGYHIGYPMPIEKITNSTSNPTTGYATPKENHL